jgi:1-deoxy-D-xylulose-5-phosphate reductoisomerase
MKQDLRAAATDLHLVPVLGRRVTILGSTGTIGAATLEVIRFARVHYGPHVFPLQALTAQKNVALLAEQAREFRPLTAVIGDSSLTKELIQALAGTGIQVLGGREGILEAAQQPSDMVMSGIVGVAGLAPTLAAVKRGAIVALANKECVIAAGEVFRRAAEDSRGVLIPVDSEHSAAFQLLDFAQAHAIEKVTLTASGGPFRTWSLERMAAATPEQAVAHPNWSMGAKISVDSATLMNKGLELIEAHVLFGLPAEKLDVIIHAQSAVHCLVAYSDGSVLAHISAPDMKTPISHALGWPRRIASPARPLNFVELTQMTFEKPDMTRFPCLQLARVCLQAGGAAPTILNAANEIAVEKFLARRIGFLGIARVVEQTLAALSRDTNGRAPETLEEVLALDCAARTRAGEASGLPAVNLAFAN